MRDNRFENNALKIGIYRPYSIRGVFRVIRRFIKNIKHAKQRVVRGYSDADLWNFDWYLQKILSSGLRDLAKTTHGYPADLADIEDWRKELNNIADLVDKINPDPDEVYKDLHIAAGLDTEVNAGKLFAILSDASEIFSEKARESDGARDAVCEWLKLRLYDLWD